MKAAAERAGRRSAEIVLRQIKIVLFCSRASCARSKISLAKQKLKGNYFYSLLSIQSIAQCCQHSVLFIFVVVYKNRSKYMGFLSLRHPSFTAFRGYVSISYKFIKKVFSIILTCVKTNFAQAEQTNTLSHGAIRGRFVYVHQSYAIYTVLDWATFTFL